MSLEIEASGNTLTLSGALNECCCLERLPELVAGIYAKTNGERLALDFSHVKHANSCGLARWISAASQFEAPVVYINAPVWLVEQFSMVGEFFQKDAIVRSFYANFYCPDLDHNKTILLTIGKEVPLLENYDNFSLTLSIDGAAFEPDFEPESYFFFVSNFLFPRKECY